MAVTSEGIRPAEEDIAIADPRFTMDVIDQIITDQYLPFRGAEGYKTERAVFVAPPYSVHRENDAEHSWHLAFTARIIWDNRELLGVNFPPDFDINKAVQSAIDHDVLEVWTGDVNALTADNNEKELKQEREAVALQKLPELYPYLGGLALRLAEYEERCLPETQFISDLDKIIATRNIFLDGGKKWHDWEGMHVTKSRMVKVVRAKLLTTFGHSLFDVMEADIESNPHVFPENEDLSDVNQQLRMF